jgi:hypothetical protein
MVTSGLYQKEKLFVEEFGISPRCPPELTEAG